MVGFLLGHLVKAVVTPTIIAATAFVAGALVMHAIMNEEEGQDEASSNIIDVEEVS